MAHYHVSTGPAGTITVSDVAYEDYEESLLAFVGLANSMFRELRGNDYDLTWEQAIEATKNGHAQGAYVGPHTLMLYWYRCDEKVHAISAWN